MKVNLYHPGTIGRTDFTVVMRGDHDVQRGTCVELEFDNGPRSQGTFDVVDVWRGDLYKIPAALLEMHHDANARTFSGFCVMHQVKHGKDAVGHGEQVTVLVLKPAGEALAVVKGSAAARVLGRFRRKR